MSFMFEFFYLTSVILNSFTFGYWLQVKMKKCICIMLNWQNTYLLDNLKY